VIEQVGTPLEIYREPASPFVADFVGKVNVMPAQNVRLSDDQIRLVASYVWGLSNPTQTAQAK